MNRQGHLTVVQDATVGVPRRASREPHVPYDRMPDGTWVYAPLGRVWAVNGQTALVCHVCGEALASVSVAHLARHGMTQAEYRERFGLNPETSLMSPALTESLRTQGRRRWESNAAVRGGLVIGQSMKGRAGRLM